jgi:hypothetical protein
LRMRFSMLIHGNLFSAFSTTGPPLPQELAAFSRLNSPKRVGEFNVVEGYNLEPVRSVYEYPLGALLHVRSTMRWNEKCLLLARTVTKL